MLFLEPIGLAIKVVWQIEDAPRGRATARPPLVCGHVLGWRPLEAALGSGLEVLRHTLEASRRHLEGVLEAIEDVLTVMLS